MTTISSSCCDNDVTTLPTPTAAGSGTNPRQRQRHHPSPEGGGGDGTSPEPQGDDDTKTTSPEPSTVVAMAPTPGLQGNDLPQALKGNDDNDDNAPGLHGDNNISEAMSLIQLFVLAEVTHNTVSELGPQGDDDDATQAPKATPGPEEDDADAAWLEELHSYRSRSGLAHAHTWAKKARLRTGSRVAGMAGSEMAAVEVATDGSEGDDGEGRRRQAARQWRQRHGVVTGRSAWGQEQGTSSGGRRRGSRNREHEGKGEGLKERESEMAQRTRGRAVQDPRQGGSVRADTRRADSTQTVSSRHADSADSAMTARRQQGDMCADSDTRVGMEGRQEEQWERGGWCSIGEDGGVREAKAWRWSGGLTQDSE
ncbi:hypothetical protein H4582DRAFT_2063612 [Lactarius indigo]|nr:hypothetical protein H4582DRAFT_2063612 [Lactarius indigo]